MNLNNIEDYLSELLSLPSSAIFEEDGELSSLCLMELNNTVDMPSGFFLTEVIRVPKLGEYFLDAEALVEKDRLVVYRAVGPLKKVGLILQTEEAEASYVDDLEDHMFTPPQFGSGGLAAPPIDDSFALDALESELSNLGSTKNFSWAICDLHGGLALFNGDVVELLSNYVDPEGVVAAISQKTKKVVLINVTQLKNLSSPPKPPTFPFGNLPLSVIKGVFFNFSQSNPELGLSKKPHTNRMKVEFDEPPPPGLDDLLNGLF